MTIIGYTMTCELAGQANGMGTCAPRINP